MRVLAEPRTEAGQKCGVCRRDGRQRIQTGQHPDEKIVTGRGQALTPADQGNGVEQCPIDVAVTARLLDTRACGVAFAMDHACAVLDSNREARGGDVQIGGDLCGIGDDGSRIRLPRSGVREVNVGTGRRNAIAAAYDALAHPKARSQIDDSIACQHERRRTVGDIRCDERQQQSIRRDVARARVNALHGADEGRPRHEVADSTYAQTPLAAPAWSGRAEQRAMRVGPGREVDHVAVRCDQPARWRVAEFLGEPAAQRILVRQDRCIGVEDFPAMGRRLHGANVLDALVEGKARQGQVTNTFAGRVRLPLRAARKIVQFSGCSAEPPDETGDSGS